MPPPMAPDSAPTDPASREPLDAPPAPTVLAFLRSLEDGRLEADLDATLRECVAALRRHVTTSGGKPKAAVTLKLGLTDDGNVLEVVGSITSTRPTPVRQRNIAFRTPGDGLSVQNPRQLPLDLAAPAATAAPVRTPDHAPAPLRVAR